MNAFYPAFSPACFSLLGLWLVVVQLRLPQWQASTDYPVYRKASYGIALHFALPGLMSVLALVNPSDSGYWRTSFAIVALGGAVVLISMYGLVRRPAPGAADSLSFPVGGSLGVASYLLTIVGYVAVGVLAIRGGGNGLITEEILLTALIFLGFNAAWLLLSDDGHVTQGSTAEPAGAAEPAEGLPAD